MAHTYGELKKMTVAQLREIAAGIQHEAVQGYTQLNKEHLLEALCKALNIDMHEHKVVKAREKAGLKSKIRELKQKRAGALQSHDRAQLKAIRHEIHELKRKLHKAAEAALE